MSTAIEDLSRIEWEHAQRMKASYENDIRLRDERIKQLENLNRILAARIDELEVKANG